MQREMKRRKMSGMELAYCGILLIGVFIGSISQVMLKKSAMRQYRSVVQEYLNPYVLAAYALFAATTLLSVLAYRVVPLSMGPVLETTSYLYITFWGVKIFHEKMNRKKFFSLTLIVAGIFVYAICG